MEDVKRNKKTSVVVEDKLEKLISNNSFSELKVEIVSLQRRKTILEPSSSVPQKQDIQRKYKNLKQTVSTVGIIGRARPYWNNTMSFQDKKDLLKIEIEKLTEHLDGKKLPMAKEVMMEAIHSAKARRSWKFCECCCCGDKFPDCESIVNHIKNAHLKITLHQQLQSLVPEMVSEEITRTVELNTLWKPIDSISAAKISENLSPEELMSVEWPYCDDSKRAAVIDDIREWLGCFISCKCFAPSLLRVLIKFTISSLQARSYPKPVLLEVVSSQPLFLICFLEAPELSPILDFLENIAETCGLFSICDIADHGSGERIVLSEDLSCLLFDERYLRGKIGEPDDEDDGCAVNSSDRGDNEEAEVTSSAAHGDDFLNWLWAGGPTIEQKLKEWTSRREAKKSRVTVLFDILKKEFGILKQECQRKWMILNYENPLVNLYNICNEEKETREKISGYEPKSYHSLLLNRKKVLEMDSNGFEFQMIGSILKVAQTDTDIEEEIKNKRHRMDIGVLRVDVVILLTNDSIRQTGLNLVCDYRFVLVTLLKSHMQECLQNQVYEDALKKSLAAEKDLLADPDLDADKNTNKGLGQGKSKRKKKKRFYRKAQDSKANGGAKEQHPPHQQNVEHLPMEEIDVLVSSDDLKLQEEELMRQAEENRKLYENLDYQRKVEEEAKRLAKQNKSTGETSAENLAAAFSEEDDGGSSEQQACLSAGHEENYPKRLDDEKAEEMQSKLNELKQELRHEAEEEQRKLDELKQRLEAEEQLKKLDALKQQEIELMRERKLDALKLQEKELRGAVEEGQRKVEEEQKKVEERQRKLNEVLKLQTKIDCLSAGHEGIDAPLTIDEWKHYEEELRMELDGVLDLQKKIENEYVGSSEQQGCLSAGHEGNYTNPEIGAPISINELKLYEKEIRRELDGVQKGIENEDVGSSEQHGCFPGGQHQQEEHSSESEEELCFLHSEEFRRRLDKELERVYKIEYEARQKILSELRNPCGVPVISTDEVKQHEEEEKEEEISDDEPKEFRRKRDEEFERFFQVEYAAKQKIISEQKTRESL